MCAESGLQLRAFVCGGERLFLESQNIERQGSTGPFSRSIHQQLSIKNVYAKQNSVFFKGQLFFYMVHLRFLNLHTIES